MIEAENERMHLMTALLLNNPGRIVRSAVVVAQALFLAWYTTMYTICPRFCHRFVGYLEEEAVKTYTSIVDLIDKGKLKGFEILAPAAVRTYWALSEDATLRDVFLAIRAGKQFIHITHVVGCSSCGWLFAMCLLASSSSLRMNVCSPIVYLSHSYCLRVFICAGFS